LSNRDADFRKYKGALKAPFNKLDYVAYHIKKRLSTRERRFFS